MRPGGIVQSFPKRETSFGKCGGTDTLKFPQNCARGKKRAAALLHGLSPAPPGVIAAEGPLSPGRRRTASTRACAGRRRGDGTFRPLPERSRGREERGGHVPRPGPPGPRAPGPPQAPAGGAEGAQVGPARPASRLRPPPTRAAAPSPPRLPLAPSLSVTSYIITRAHHNGSDARCRGPSPAPERCSRPEPAAPELGARARGSGAGEGPERRPGSSLLAGGAAPAGPRQEAASVTNCVSFSKHISRSPCSPGAAAPEAGPRPGLERAPRGGESSSGPSPRPHGARPPAPPAPLRAPPASPGHGRPPGAARPPPPAGRAPRRRPPPPPPPPPAQRKAATPETSPGRAAPRRAERGSRPGKPPGEAARAPRIALTLLSGGHDPGGPRGARGARARARGARETKTLRSRLSAYGGGKLEPSPRLLLHLFLCTWQILDDDDDDDDDDDSDDEDDQVSRFHAFSR
ncbi:uncharacterized protein [Vulpes vulpes]|uniref:Basic proline-rich protein-like n=1 Tax=Vulpes vulpes TaxID=9627 RepID=A0ABM4YVC1_VULVU